MEIFEIKKFNEDYNYTTFTEEMIDVDILPLQDITFTLSDNDLNISEQSILKIPEYLKSNIEDLLEYFEIQDYLGEFLTFTALIQKEFLYHLEQDNDRMVEEFYNQKKELAQILTFFEDFNPKKIYSVTLRLIDKDITIKNTFNLIDIFNAIRNYYGLENDTTERITELLEDDFFKLKQRKNYIKSEVVSTILDFFQKISVDKSNRQQLSFCGVFLQICQIPPNNKDLSIPRIENIEDAMKLIEPTNMKHYQNNRFNFYL
ncbi:MAG: hypothetical protein KGV44_03305 [Flavobacteriaceae bacterium]|nr:hypothetical protein [Flavobacteriaceae bacterium]